MNGTTLVSQPADRPPPAAPYRIIVAVIAALLVAATIITGTPARADLSSDTTPPRITLDVPPSPGQGTWTGWYAGPVEVSVSATDAAGIRGFGYRLTGAQAGEATGDLEPLRFTITEPGVTTITVTAEDNNGNQAVREYGVGLDLTDPTLEVGGTVLDGGVIRRGDRRTLTFGCADVGTSIESCTASPNIVSGGQVPTAQLGEHRLVVTARDHVGRSRTQTIVYVVEKPLLRLVNPPVIKGDPPTIKVGQVLEATVGTWSPAAERVSYQWLRFGNVVGTAPTYSPTPADVGSRISLTTTAHHPDYADTPVRWTTGFVLVEPGEFRVTGSPTVTGPAQVGGTLRIAQPGTIVPTPSVIRNLWTIDGEEHETDGPELELTEEHRGATVSCVQVYTGPPGYDAATVPCVFPGGAASVVVAPKPVEPKPEEPKPEEPGTPGTPGDPDKPGDGDTAWRVLTPAAIKGKARVGQRLRVVRPDLSAPATRWTYQWLRNGKRIKGATKATYRLRKADRKRRLTLRIIASAPGRPDLISTATTKRVRR